MKHSRLLTALIVLFALCLLAPLSAQAVDFGTRAYGECDNVVLSSSSTVAQVLDWLDDYLDNEVGYIMENTTDMMELVSLVQNDASAAASLPENGSIYQSAMDVYTRACDHNTEVSFYYDRLRGLYAQDEAIRTQIRSGELSARDVDELKRELDAADSEADRLRKDAVSKQASWKSDCASIEQALLSASSPSEPKQYLTQIRDLAQPILHKQAEDIAAQENSGSAPIVTVISDKEIAFTALVKNGNENVGIQGVTVEVWPRGNPSAKKTLKTNDKGVAIFWAVDFKPDSRGQLEIEVVYDGSTAEGGKKYQRRELGVLYMRGGDAFHLFPTEDSGAPYIVRATIDDLDMLCVDNGYALSRYNDVDHTVSVKVDTKGKSVGLKAWYYGSGSSQKELFTQKFVAGDTTAHSMTKKWLQYGSGDCLPDGTALYFTLSDTNGEFDMLGDPKGSKGSFSSKKSVVEKPGKEDSADPAKGMLGKIGFAVPDDIPFIGGAKLDFPMESNWTIVIVPGSNYYIGYNHEFKPDKTRWQNQNAKELTANDRAIKEVGAGVVATAKQKVKEEYMRSKRKCFLSETSMTITPYFFVSMEHASFTSGACKGSVTAGLIVTYSWQMTKQFHIGVVPAFISLDLGLSVGAGGSIGATGVMTPQGRLKDLNATKDGSLNFHINVHVYATITVGAGLPRFAYIGLRAAGFLDFNFAFGTAAPKPTLSLGIHADVVVKFFCFSKEWTFWDKSKIIPLGGVAQDVFFEAALAETQAALGSGETPVLDAVRVADTEEETVDYWQGYAAIDIGSMMTFEDENDPNRGYCFYISSASRDQDDTIQMYTIPDLNNPKSDSRIDYLRLPTFPDGYRHIYDFDMDYYNGTFYLSLVGGKMAPSDLPKDEDELRKFRLEHKDDFFFLACSFKSYTTMETSCILTGVISSMPRIKALYQPYMGITYVVGGVQARNEKTETLILSCDYTLKNKGYVETMVGSNVINDVVLLDYISIANATPVLSAFAIEATGRLVFCETTYTKGWSGAGPIQFNGNAVQCIGLSKQIWWNRGSDTNTAFLLTRGSTDKSMPQSQYAQSPCILFLPRFNGKNAQQSLAYTIKDTGINASSDGVRTVNVKVDGGYQVYAYWGDSRKEEYPGAPEISYYIKACLIDLKTQLCSEQFDWVKLSGALQKVNILPIKDAQKPVHAFFLEPQMEYDAKDKCSKIKFIFLKTLKFQLSPAVSIRSFCTEYPVVTQGKDFGMYFRLENTGSLVVKSVDIDVEAKQNGSPDEKLKTLHIDLTNPLQNSVTHYERDPAADNYITTGEHTVYRIEDVNDSYNGELLQTTVYDGATGKSTTQTEQLKAFLPGALRTYKATVTQSPTKWHGEYALYAKVVKIGFTMAVGEYADGTQPTEYVATWNDATGDYDIAQLSSDGAMPMSDEPLALFGVKTTAPSLQAAAGGMQGNIELNMELNDGLTRSDELYAAINNNDLEISADTVNVQGERIAVINLRNDTQPMAPDVVPKLTATIVRADGTESVTYTQALKTSLTGGFTRTLTIPVSELSGGQPYAELILSVDSADGQPYYEINAATRTATIYPNSSFNVEGPDDVTVYNGDGQNAVFAVEVGAENPDTLTYQWKVMYPDGSEHSLLNANGAVLEIEQPNLSDNGKVYFCVVSDGETVESSRYALLTVLSTPPKTGDAFPTQWMLALLLVSAGVLMLALRRRKA